LSVYFRSSCILEYPKITICICGFCDNYGKLSHLRLLFVFGLFPKGGFRDRWSMITHNLEIMYNYFNIIEQITVEQGRATNTHICMKCEEVYVNQRCVIHLLYDNMKMKPVTQLSPADDAVKIVDSPAGIRFMLKYIEEPLLRTLPERYKFCKTSQAEVSSSRKASKYLGDEIERACSNDW
jgi:hypothetical protein